MKTGIFHLGGSSSNKFSGHCHVNDIEGELCEVTKEKSGK